MQLVQFHPSHGPQVQVQQAQLGEVRPVDWDALARFPSWTMLRGDTPLVIAGVIPQWHGRAEAWALLGELDRYALLTVHRAVCGALDGVQRDPAYARIETVVRNDFTPGHTWARMLGFRMEGVMHRYGLDGKAYAMYARIKWPS